MQINPQTITQTLTVFIGNLPTFIAVILAWMHSNGRFSDAQARTNDIKSDLSKQIELTRDLLRAEFRRVEEVMDARIKHLEERER